MLVANWRISMPTDLRAEPLRPTTRLGAETTSTQPERCGTIAPATALTAPKIKPILAVGAALAGP
ncbi:Uncharacterised protein [Mycobacteroides abscessus subsp. massiliense]|nr:Uncharacterised protein [Mycobacteroides abscessus subsp. massiliense]